MAEQEKEIVRNPSSQELDFEEPPNYKNIFKNDLTNLSNGLFLMHQKSIQQNTGAKGFRPASIRDSFRLGQRELTKRASTSQASSLHRQSADLVETLPSPPQQKETPPEIQKPQEPQKEREKSSSPKEKEVKDEETKTKTEFHRSSYTSSINKRKQDPNKRLLNNTFIIFSKNNRTTPVNNPHPNMQLYLQMLDRVENSKHKETKIPWSMAAGSSFDLGINSPGYLPAVSAGKKKNIKIVRPPTLYKNNSPRNKNELNIKLPEHSFENHGQPFEVVMQSTQPRSTTKRDGPQKPVLNIIQPISLVSIKDSLSNRLSPLKLRSPKNHNIPLSRDSSKEANSLDNSVENDSSRGASLARGNSDELGPNTIQLEDDLIEPKVPTNPTYLYPTTMPKSGEVTIRRKRRDLFTPYAQLDDVLDYSNDLYSPEKKEMHSFVYTHSPNKTQMRWPSIQKSRTPIIIKEYAGTSHRAANYLSKMSSLSPLLEETIDSKGTRESYKMLQKLSKSTRQNDHHHAPIKEYLIRDGKPQNTQRPIQNVSGLRAEALPVNNLSIPLVYWFLVYDFIQTKKSNLQEIKQLQK